MEVALISEQPQPGMNQWEVLALKIPGRPQHKEITTNSRRALNVNDSEPVEMSSEELARRSAQGSLESFEQIVLRFQSQIFNFLHVYIRHRQDAEDLTQDTFCKAWSGLHRYNPSLSFAPWLFAIARHAAASHFRSARSFDELPQDTGITEETPANLLAAKDDSAALWRLARTLKPRHWEALWFRYGEGFSVEETARAMRLTQIHVKVLLHRARAELAKRLVGRSHSLVRKPPESGTQATQASEK